MPNHQRIAALPNQKFVVFIVGMRFNQLWAVHKWLPVVTAMGKMLSELMRHSDLGLIGKPRSFLSGRLLQVQSYWSSYELLETFAGSQTNEHLPAWKSFNQKSRGNTSVGIFHETYVVDGPTYEAIYVNVDQPILLGAAIGVTEITKTSNTSRQRLRG